MANLPTVDLEFILNQLHDHPKLHSTGCIGKTTYFVIKGNKPIAQRMVITRETEVGQVSFEFAVSTSIRFAFLPKLLDWLERNRKWKDGGYFV